MGRIDVAYVEVLPDLSNFDRQALVDVKSAFKSIQAEVDKAMKAIERAVDDAGQGIAADLRKVEREAESAFRATEQEAAKAARGAEREYQRLSKEATREIRKIEQEAKKQDATIKIKVEADRKALAKTQKDTTDFLKTSLVNGLKGVGIAAGAALAAGLLPSVLNVVSALAPAIAGLGAALPGAIAVAGASVATLVLGFQGLGDAIKDIGDAEKFNEALKKLAPSAQAFAIALRDALPQLKEIQQAVQQNLFAGLDSQLKGMVATLAGPLKTGLAGIASEFNNIAKEAGTFFQSQAAVDALNAVLGSTRDIIKEFGPAIQPLLNGFSALAVAAQPFISALSGGLADVAKRFGDFLTQAGQSGALNDFFSTALATLGDLGLILRDVGSILKSVFQAGATDGGSLLSRFQELTRTVADFFKSAEGKEALTALFSTLATTTSALLDVVKPILPLFASLVSLAGAELTGALKALAAILVPVVKAFADGLKPVMPQLIQAAKDLTPFLIQLGEALGKHLAAQIKELMPSIVELISVFVKELLPLLIQVIPIAIQLIPVFTQIALVFAKLAVVLLKITSIGIGTFLKSLKAVLSIDWNGIGDAIGGAFSKAWDAVKKFFSDIGTSIGDFFKGIGKWFSDGFTSAQEETTGFFSKLGKFFSELPGKIGEWLSELPGKLVDALNNAFDAAVQAIGRAIGLVLFAVLVLPGKIKDGLVSLGETIRVAVVNAWDTAKQWTETKIGELVEFVSGLPEKATNAISSLKEKLTTFITETWNSFTTFTVTKWDEIIAFLGTLPQKALDAIFAMKQKVTSFINETVESARQGAVNGFNAVVDFIKSVPGKIGELRQMFINAGKGLIDGFINGFKNVGNFIGDVAGSIVGSVKSFINRVIGNLNSGIADIDAKLPGDLPRIPYLAAGGIVSGATTAVVGEAGPEAVIPLSGNRGRKALAAIGGNGGGGQSVTFEAGAIAISFEGVVPSQTEATQTGESVAAGIVSALMRRDVRLEMRMV